MTCPAVLVVANSADMDAGYVGERFLDRGGAWSSSAAALVGAFLDRVAETSVRSAP